MYSTQNVRKIFPEKLIDWVRLRLLIFLFSSCSHFSLFHFSPKGQVLIVPNSYVFQFEGQRKWYDKDSFELERYCQAMDKDVKIARRRQRSKFVPEGFLTWFARVHRIPRTHKCFRKQPSALNGWRTCLFKYFSLVIHIGARRWKLSGKQDEQNG